ncbi:MAG: PqqD family protein [Clostridia bacterium]|nr:PqqD family protein [Clostridia bacterium]
MEQKTRKLKKGFVLRKVAGQTLVVATGEASKDFHGMIKLNESAEVIWKELAAGKSDKEIADRLMEVYAEDDDFDRKRAEEETAKFLKAIEDAGFFEK